MRNGGTHLSGVTSGFEDPSSGKLTHPRELGSYEQFAARVFNSHCLTLSSENFTDIRRNRSSGQGTKIGIVDSIADVPKQYKNKCRVEHQHDFTGSSARDPKDHGTPVFETLYTFAPSASYSFYRIFDSVTDLESDDLLEPLDAARKDGIDILNISAGYWHPEHPQQSQVARAVRQLADSGVTVVAASGNVGENPQESVNGPAFVDEAIAVGGFVSLCRATEWSKSAAVEFERQNKNCKRYWIDPMVGEFSGIYCGQQGCSSAHSCNDYRREIWWPGNVQPVDNKPDILAPPDIPTSTPYGEYGLRRGTSFACPMVAGFLARLHSEEPPKSKPSPKQLRQATIAGGISIDDSSGLKFNLENTKKKI